MNPYYVLITDTVTCETRRYEDPDSDFHEFAWSEGNFACDCNRGLLFARTRGLSDPNHPCTGNRFRVRIYDARDGRLLYEDGTEAPTEPRT